MINYYLVSNMDLWKLMAMVSQQNSFQIHHRFLALVPNGFPVTNAWSFLAV
jgi:hypothetical protein